LLLEDARTNLIPNSIPVAGWAPTDVLLTGASGIAPDGTNTMVRIAEDGVNTFHMNLLLATVVASTTYAVSVYAKAAQVRYLQVLLDNNGGVGSWATFDLQTGTISGPIAMNGVTGSGASIQAAGNGIYRCVVTSTVGASTTGRVSLGLSNVPNPGAFPGYQGNPANGLLIWGAQLEQGGSATSYIPTAGTAVTRAIDGCAISPANMSPWFASPGGSWVVELISFNPAPANSRVVGQANVAGSICPIYIDSAAKGGQFDGVSAVTTANATVANVVTKISSAWGVGQAKACANGGVVASSAALTTGYGALVASGIKFMTLVAAAPADCTNGYIRRVQYWPRVLSDAEMQQVTT
jgi:hypothetical protein